MAQQIARDEREAAQTAPGRPMPSYHPTRSALANRALDVADRVTNGRAGWVQRFVSYGFIGGFAAVVNLILFNAIFYLAPLPYDHAIWWQDLGHYIIAFVVASEISIFANFIPNDYFTFRHLPGHQRSWLARAVRFHVTCMVGVLLTFLISVGLHFVGIAAGLAQAMAIAIVFLFNFTFHHVFTYRHIKH
jgi:putative flippase GtrA